MASDEKVEERADPAVESSEGEDAGFVPMAEPGDWFLRNLVHLTNKHSLEFPATLTVGGFLVSGLVISGAAYFAETAKQFSADGVEPGSVADQLGQLIGSYTEIYAPGRPETRPAAYIHLRKARMYHNSGNPIPAGASVLWRGRISQVAGFTFGTLQIEE